MWRKSFLFISFKRIKYYKNNLNGINVDDFINTVQKVILDNNEKDFENIWRKVFKIYFDNCPKSKIFNKEILTSVIKEMRFETNGEDIEELVDKMGGDIDGNKFVKMKKAIEEKK